MFRPTVLILACALLPACGARDATQTGSSSPRPVVLQGAIDIEIARLVETLGGAKREEIADWTFWTGTLDGYRVVVSKTRIGMANASAATAIAAEHFRPAAIINQGTSGGHQPDLHVYDIVVGKESVNLGAFRTPFRARGQGSSFADWGPIDQLRSGTSVSLDPNAQTMHRFRGDDGLLAAALAVRDKYQKGRVVEGVIGSSDTWNSELDRIQRFHNDFGTTVEEMETAGAAQVAGSFRIPFLGIRVLSNNITNNDAYDARSAEACQDYVRAVLKQYMEVRRN
jgi:adenosylhomocysteine nucleosidase